MSLVFSEPENDNISENIQEEAIPTGVSIESASYIESTNENSLISDDEDTNIEEEHTPKLFLEDDQAESEKELYENSNSDSDQLFDQDSNEEEDFEIPAFLRKQKF